MSAKPMTKALHTVRVVGALAAYLRTNGHSFPSGQPDAASVLATVLGILGNAAPTDAVLLSQCLAACKAA